MKNFICLTIVTLFLFTFLASCRSTTVTDPAGESESISASAPSVIEEESESPSPIPSPAPQKSPSPSPSPEPLYPELPLPVEEICWQSSILQEGSGVFEIDGVPFYSFYSRPRCPHPSEHHVIAFFSA